MMNEQMKNKLIEKIRMDGGDESFVDTLTDVLNKENISADKSKKEYFKIEIRVIMVSMLSSIMAGLSAIDDAMWSGSFLSGAKLLINVLSIALPAVVTMLVAYRGVKKSYETWIRHRKYDLETRLVINNYLYGNEEFDELSGKKAYKKFRNEIQGIWRGSMNEFLNNMNK